MVDVGRRLSTGVALAAILALAATSCRGGAGGGNDDSERADQYPGNLGDDASCRSGAPRTDPYKHAASVVESILRSGGELSTAEEMEVGRIFLRRLSTDSDSPYRGRIDTSADASALAYVQEVGGKMAALRERPGIEYTFHVIHGKDLNAFSTPGGQVFIFTALLENRHMIANEAQLAGVLAHEVGHIDLRHTTAVLEVLNRGHLLGTAAEMPLSVVLDLVHTTYASVFEDEADAYATRKLFVSRESPFQFMKMWHAWDREFAEGKGGAAPRLEGEARHDNGPLGAFGDLRGFLGEAVSTASQIARELQETHNPPQRRACLVAAEIDKLRSQYPGGSYVIGTQRLASRLGGAER